MRIKLLRSRLLALLCAGIGLGTWGAILMLHDGPNYLNRAMVICGIALDCIAKFCQENGETGSELFNQAKAMVNDVKKASAAAPGGGEQAPGRGKMHPRTEAIFALALFSWLGLLMTASVIWAFGSAVGVWWYPPIVTQGGLLGFDWENAADVNFVFVMVPTVLIGMVLFVLVFLPLRFVLDWYFRRQCRQVNQVCGQAARPVNPP